MSKPKTVNITLIFNGDSGPPIWILPKLKLDFFRVDGARCVTFGLGWLYWCGEFTIGIQ